MTPGNRRLAFLALAAIVVVGLVVWLVTRDGDDDESPPTVAVSVAEEDLVKLSQETSHPVYWAGPDPNVRYELTKAQEGRIFIRYLPAGVKVGDPRPDFLTVATYPLPDGYERLKAIKGAKRRRLPGGGLAVLDSGKPTSAYLAYPDGGYQVEVHDPKPERALNLIATGRIRPIR